LTGESSFRAEKGPVDQMSGTSRGDRPESSSGDPAREREFDRLLRSAMRQPMGEFRRSSEESVTAYLLGVATEQEREEVQSALVASSDFRGEMLEAARELDRLESADEGAGSERVEVPATPTLREFLKQRSYAGASGESLGQGVAVHRKDKGHTGAARGFLETMQRFFTPGRGIGFGAATLGAVVMLMVFLRGGQAPLSVSTGGLLALKWGARADLFAPTTLRSGEAQPDIDEETAREAAMLSFQGVITYQNGEFALDRGGPEAVPGHDRRLVLRVTDRDGRELARLSGGIPSSAAEPTAIILPLRARSLDSYAFPMRSDSAEIVWKGSRPDSGAVTFVYARGKRYGASTAVPFRFQ
jgi:hypothetical protein